MRVEVVGFASAVGVIETKPAAVWLATVRLPVTASAPAGTPQWPPTGRVLGMLDLNEPVRPLSLAPERESRTRPGFSG